MSHLAAPPGKSGYQKWLSWSRSSAWILELPAIVNVRYAALAVFFDAFDLGFSEAFFFAAQKAFIFSACRLR